MAYPNESNDDEATCDRTSRTHALRQQNCRIAEAAPYIQHPVAFVPERADEVTLIETEDGVQRMTLREMFGSFERDLEDFEALNVCVG